MKEQTPDATQELSPKVSRAYGEFQDLTLEELSDELPSPRDIQ